MDRLTTRPSNVIVNLQKKEQLHLKPNVLYPNPLIAMRDNILLWWKYMMMVKNGFIGKMNSGEYEI